MPRQCETHRPIFRRDKPRRQTPPELPVIFAICKSLNLVAHTAASRLVPQVVRKSAQPASSKIGDLLRKKEVVFFKAALFPSHQGRAALLRS